MRFINDNNLSNLFLWYLYDKMWRLYYLALRDIEKGEELSVGYG